MGNQDILKSLMSARMKKHPIELRFVGPPENKDKAITILENLDFKDVSDTVHWHELFPEYTAEELSGVVLAGSRIKEGLTQKQLSEISGIPQSHISEMENGKRSIGKKGQNSC